jgi:hypothetical protein
MQMKATWNKKTKAFCIVWLDMAITVRNATIKDDCFLNDNCSLRKKNIKKKCYFNEKEKQNYCKNK